MRYTKSSSQYLGTLCTYNPKRDRWILSFVSHLLNLPLKFLSTAVVFIIQHFQCIFDSLERNDV